MDFKPEIVRHLFWGEYPLKNRSQSELSVTESEALEFKKMPTSIYGEEINDNTIEAAPVAYRIKKSRQITCSIYLHKQGMVWLKRITQKIIKINMKQESADFALLIN